MSKLAKMIEARFTGNQAYAEQKISGWDFVVATRPVNSSVVLPETIREYVFTLECWVKKYVSENEDEKEVAFKHIKRAMIEQVFGEFRPLIIEMHSALYDNDRTRVSELLNKLEDTMFNEI